MRTWKRLCAQVLIVACIFSQMGDYVSANGQEKRSVESTAPEETTKQEEVHSNEIIVDSIDQLESEHEYANNTDTTWVYKHTGAGKLKVTFSKNTQVETNADFIYLYDATGTQIGTYTGKELASETIEVMGDTIKIRLVSDFSTVGYGFAVTNIAAMESIEVETLPNVTQTIIGNTFNFNGLTVVGHYDDGSKEDITKACTLGAYDVSEEGQKEITVEYQGLHTSFTMNCKEVKFTAIKVKQLSTNYTVYYKGNIDLEDLQVVGVDSEGTEYSIDKGYTLSKISNQKIGMQKVVVTYEDLTTSFELEVKYAFLYKNNSTYIEVTGIENSAATEVYIPEMIEGLPVKSIARSAFSGETNLEYIELPDSITSIPSFAFYNCKSLKELVIPETVTDIGESAFFGCSSITSLTIPVSTTVYRDSSRGGGAFYECSGMTTLHLTKGTGKMVDYDAMYLVSSGIGNYYKYRPWNDSAKNLTTVTIAEGVENIGSYALINLVNLENIEIPSTVTRIGEYAFTKCSKLKELQLPDGVTELGEDSFSSCSALTKINIPSGITSIPNNAFYGCESLEEVVIPETVTNIGETAFYECSGITSLTIPVSTTISRADSQAKGPFYGCSGMTTLHLTKGTGKMVDYDAIHLVNSEISNDYQYRPWNDSAKNLTTVTIAEGVENIGSYALINLDNLENIEIPSTVTRIGKCAFTKCSKLKELQLPDGITELGESSFRECSALTKINIPSGITSIQNNTFCYCESLKEVVIPETVTDIGVDAFYECSGITSLTIPVSATVSKSQTQGKGSFYGCSKMTTLHLTKGTGKMTDYVANNWGESGVSKYFGHRPWHDSAKNLTTVTIAEGVENIGSYALYDLINLESIEIPSTLTKIGACGFNNCSKLKEIQLPARVTELGEGSFGACSALTKINIPSGITSIPENAFAYNESLLSIALPEGVSSIGAKAFYNCSNLETLEAPDSVQTIGETAFANCKKLNIYANVGTTVYNYAKENYIPVSSTQAIDLDSKKVSLYIDKTQQLTAVVTMFNGQQDSTAKPSWSSADETVASVSDTGIVTANGLGKTYVTATYEGKSVQCEVTVLLAAGSVELSQDQLELQKSEQATLYATISPTNSTDKITWTSSNPEIVSVDSEGRVSALRSGTAVITATAESGASATCTVTVPKIDINELTFTLSQTQYEYSGKAYYPAVISKNALVADRDYTVTYSNQVNVGTATVTITGQGDYTGTKVVSYAITAKSIERAAIALKSVNYVYSGNAFYPGATVRLDGAVLRNNVDYTVSYYNNKAVGKGEVRIVGKGNYKGSSLAYFNILPKLHAASYRIYVGTGAKIGVTSTARVSYQSSNPSVVRVSASGQITGVRRGTASIIVVSNGQRVSCSVTVLDPVLSKRNETLYVGGRSTLRVTGGSGSIKWSTSNSKIATVSSRGVITVKRKGTVVISATRNGVTMRCRVTVKEPSISNKNLALKVRGSKNLKVTGGSGSIRWSSSNKSVATVTSRGVVKAKKKGTTTITAIRNGVKMTCRITVR